MKSELKTINIWMVIIIIVVLFAPWVLTQSLGLTSFTTTGQIGDTIGGTTSPIINLFAAYLLYLTLKAQIKANEVIQIQFDAQILKDNQIKIENRIRENINNVIYNIDNFVYTPYETTYIGQEGIKKFFKDVRHHHFTEKNIMANNVELNQMYYIILFLNNICEQIKKSELSNEDQEYLFKLISFNYYVKIYSRMIGKSDIICEKNNPCSCGKCRTKSGMPKKVMDEIITLEKCLSKYSWNDALPTFEI